MTHWNKAFWLLFIVMGALVITALIARVLFIDLILGFFVIAIGVLKLGEELSSKEVVERHDDIKDNIRYLSHQVDAGNLFTRRIKEKHEHRFLRLDNKRAGIESTIEDKYDSLAKKLIQMENRVNDVTKAIVEVSKRHDSFSKDASKEIKGISRLKDRTDRMSEKLRKIRLPKPAAKPMKTPKTNRPKPTKANTKPLKTTKAKK